MFDDMNDNKETTGGQGPQASATSSDNTVDLFPALADKRMTPINTIRPPVHAKQGTQISIFNPVTFDEALDIVECLRSRAATTITLDNMKKIDAHRLVDFVAGASSALQGNFHKLSEQVYIFCPANIKISVPEKINANSGIFSDSKQSLDFLYQKDMQEIKTWPPSARFSN